jgi:histidine kinase
MRGGRSLSFRLLIAMLTVVAVGALTLFVTARVLAPRLFDDEVQRLGQRYGWSTDGVSPGGGGPGGRGAGGTGPEAAALEGDLDRAFIESLNLALVAALGAGALTAVAGAVVVSRRVLLPLDRMRGAVRRMATGRYGERIPRPVDRELAQLADDVNALGEALAATEERRARLVSDLAHELRTPITSIDGFLEGLEDGVFDPDPETLGAMRSETGRLQRLAADLGALSRADEAAFDLQVQEADLASVAAGAARAAGAAFAAKGVILEVAPMADLPVRVDVDRMVQVFSNLLHNALRHTPRGGTVRVTAERHGESATVVVTDDGEGIPADHLSRIFDRFFRGDDGSAGGSGIGLTIARSITRAHGGDLTAASEGAGTGASFNVTIPLDG